MRPCEEYRDLQVLEDFLSSVGGVVASIIQHDDGIFSPVFSLFVKNSGQAVKEDLHYLSVGVGLD